MAEQEPTRVLFRVRIGKDVYNCRGQLLRERGLGRIFVEGGGVTVSRFLEARALARLHVTICPIFIGRGRPGISLPAIDDLGDALRPRARRFDLGDDVLFDCKLDRAA